MMDEYRGQTVTAAASATAEEPAAPCTAHLPLLGPWRCQKGYQNCHRHNAFVASLGRTGYGFRAVA